MQDGSEGGVKTKKKYCSSKRKHKTTLHNFTTVTKSKITERKKYVSSTPKIMRKHQ